MTTEKIDTTKVSKALAAAPRQEIIPGMSLKALLQTHTVKQRFETVLGKKAAGFMSSIITATQLNPKLNACDPMTVLSAAAVAAALDLPINSSLGFAHIVPYKDRAQFQMGWKGFVQLAMRSGQYLTLNVSEVFEGELKSNDKFRGLMEFNAEGKKSNVIIGYVAYMKLLNGFEKWAYMTKDAVEAHGKRFSKSFGYDSSVWKLDFDAMAKKTVVKGLLSKWGILSIEMQNAIEKDQAVILDDDKVEYPDAPAHTTDSEPEVIPPAKTEAKTQEKGQDDGPGIIERVTATQKDGKDVYHIYHNGKKYTTVNIEVWGSCKTLAAKAVPVFVDGDKDGNIVEVRPQ